MITESNSIDGVRTLEPSVFKDSRGELTVFYRKSDTPYLENLQINIVRSKAKTFRGMHIHSCHSDYLYVVDGELHLGMVDFRKGSKTFGVAQKVLLTGEKPECWIIPEGVAHGFYCPVNTVYCYGLSKEWDVQEDFAFHWHHVRQELSWDMVDPVMSERDMHAGSIHEVVGKYESKVTVL
ncbi:hypothetical protein C4K68_01015 [Pokkaliibacter plantistimulans]|uniref:dTDP-4-dehydrorhamnose 3,5-epimerase n=1 Tax=Proteobacteria bacterium 228 TaxID=2083153 RepID=A0A2S5KYH0_9PROT|nr:dTDP-4-dehydrorhamnose 3,5-epimerase family protein [Pokkaliibacter plantistimulans]PPC79316.1 hypothetical protein C4K68_01015 [Pokkaliibacter plantistimulans]